MPLRILAAALVHLLTASGVVCSLLAFQAISVNMLDVAYIWLALALFIDAVDGPLARLVDTKTYLPRFSGERLDLIIDYLNYVALPAFIVVKAPLIEGQMGMVAAIAILLTSLFHFSDTQSKTRDGYFIGFPAIWNIVLLYLLVFGLRENVAFVVIGLLSLATFWPLRWLHPFRVVHLRWLTIFVVSAWSFAAGMAILSDFVVGPLEKSLLILAPAYLVILSLKRSYDGSVQE